TPAPLANDATYLRRVWLDVAGTIPPLSEARRYLDDSAVDRRGRVVEQLLDGPGYVYNFTNVWRTSWLPEAANNYQVRFVTIGFESWLRQKLADNAPYDQMVREVLTTPVSEGRGNPFESGRKLSPYGFYYGKEMKPENLASATSRLFLGVR